MKTILEEKDVEWVVNNLGELGVKIGDQFFFLYKGESLLHTEESDATLWRRVDKREFGEVCKTPFPEIDHTKEWLFFQNPV
jgi:hypothetical protein